jgi:hypothetical protein
MIGSNFPKIVYLFEDFLKAFFDFQTVYELHYIFDDRKR